MLYERIEPGVLRDDVKEPGWVRGGKTPKVEGDVEIEGVGSGRFELDVLCTRAEVLHGKDEVDRQLRVLRAEEDHDLEVFCRQQVERLDVDILEVDEDVVGSQFVLRHEVSGRGGAHRQRAAAFWVADTAPEAAALAVAGGHLDAARWAGGRGPVAGGGEVEQLLAGFRRAGVRAWRGRACRRAG